MKLRERKSAGDLPVSPRNGHQTRGEDTPEDWSEQAVPAGIPFPPPVKLAQWLAKPMPQRPEVVRGLLRRGDKMTMAGSSKSKKTWFVSDLALCVSVGKSWMGFQTVKTPVMFLNLELPEDSFHERMTRLCSALQIPQAAADFTIWNLRGHKASIERLDLALRDYPDDFGLLVLDPLYKVLGGRVENAAEDVADLMNELEAIATRHSCALVVPAHFSKGNQSEKESIDRLSGSGVFSRDADAIVTMTAHEEEDAFTVESILRSFPPIEPFVVRWEFPLFQRDDDLDPADLKKKAGRPSKTTKSELADLLPVGGMTYTAWLDAAEAQLKMSRTTFQRKRTAIMDAGLVTYSGATQRYERSTQA